MPLIKPTAQEKKYICQAADLAFGESLFIEMKTKKQQMHTFTQLTHAAKEYCVFIDPDISLAVLKTFQDGKLWIKIIKEKAADHHYVVGTDGKVRREDAS